MSTSMSVPDGAAMRAARRMLPVLALAQFIASYAATNMNVAIGNIAHDLNTTVTGVQTAITLFTLTMAALMIPGSKLSDIWGRRRCFALGIAVYGVGALLAAFAPTMGVMILGYSLLEGIGSALMIPPIYILVTLWARDVTTRAKAFGVISAAAGVGAAAGPLIGGLITSTTSWRVSFFVQFLVVAAILVLTRFVVEPPLRKVRPKFDLEGAALSAAGLFFIVLGILQSSTYGWFTAREDFIIGSTVVIPKGGISPLWPLVGVGLLFLLWFVLHVRRRERKGREPLVSLTVFRNMTSNFGLFTQLDQWLILQGSFFVVSVFLQEVRGFSAIQTGLVITAATAGILLSSALAGRFARRRAQTTLVRGGFVLSIAGMLLLLFLSSATSSVAGFIPGLFLMGFGVGVMLTASVNVVQSSFPESEQGEISGLSRSVSNLGSSLGTAIAGSVLVSATLPGNGPYHVAMIVLAVVAALGLVAALLMRAKPVATTELTGRGARVEAVSGESR